MDFEEMSNEFDSLLNSSFIANELGEQSSKIDIQLDEYEKSLFLTQAQEQLVINLYNGRNIEGLSFESAEESRRYLKELTVTETINLIDEEPIRSGLYPNSYKIDMSTYGNLLFVTREAAKFAKYVLTEDTSVIEDKNYYSYNNVTDIFTKVSISTGNPKTLGYYEEVTSFKPWQTGNNLIVEVVPITQDEYHRIKRNPYKKFNDERVLRIENNNEWYLYSKYALKDYSIDYIKKPRPIIVAPLGDLSIDGYDYDDVSSEEQASELNPILHRTILLEAVKLAKIVKQNQIRNEMLGNMPGQLVHPPMQPVTQRPN